MNVISQGPSDKQYYDFEAVVARRILESREPLFTVNVDYGLLSSTYLRLLSIQNKQHYNCSCCKRFIERYGKIVTINESGRLDSLLWDANEVPHFFEASVSYMEQMVENGLINGVFIPDQKIWGTPRTGNWTHLHGIYGGPVYPQDADKRMAEKREEYAMLHRALASYSKEQAEQIVRILESETLAGSEKALAMAQWFLGLYDIRKKRNLIWLAVANAPTGFCHIRSSMISTLFDDLSTGADFEDMRVRWNLKMHPLKYRRTTSLKQGNIKVAEKKIQELGLTLKRRFGNLSDLEKVIWSKQGFPPRIPTGGLFDHLKKPVTQKLELPSVTYTWEKFMEKVGLADVSKIELQVPGIASSFYALTTGDEDLFSYGSKVSYFQYHNGTRASEWNLTPHSWVEVTAIFDDPARWAGIANDRYKQQVFFALKDCYKINYQHGGGFFCEDLKSEFHDIQSTLEQHVKTAKIEGRGNANGWVLTRPCNLRITNYRGEVANYHIDRIE